MRIRQPLAQKVAPPTAVDKAKLGVDPAGHPEKMPPSELADRVQHAITRRELSDSQRQTASRPLHWATGLATGLTYALVADRVPALRAGYGLLAGIGLFAAAHLTVLPAAGLQDPAARMPLAWWGWEGGSHLVYGLTLDTGLRGLDRLRSR